DRVRRGGQRSALPCLGPVQRRHGGDDVRRCRLPHHRWMSEKRAAAFLDRDGTIIVDKDYPGDPEAVELLPGAAAAIARLQGHGWPVLMVTNQSGIGRGLITEADYAAVQARMEALLAA